MKILMVNKFLHPNGGSETYIFKLGAQLQSMGHEVQYFGMEHEGRIVGNHVNAYTTDMDFHGGSKLAKLTYPIKTVYSAEARRKIRLVLDDFQPDVCHLNNFNYQLTPSIILEIRKWEKQSGHQCKIVYTAHDGQLVCPNHLMKNPLTGKTCTKCLNGNCLHCITGKCIHGSFAKSVIGATEGLFWNLTKVYLQIDTVIAPSHFLAEKLGSNPVLKERIVVLPNFIDMLPVQCTAAKEDYVLYYGRYSGEKGINTLLRAADCLQDIPFVFAGDGPLKSSLTGHTNVTDKGFLSGSELVSLISNARFTVVPSECFENCPFTVMESQMLGTPVLGADIGGIPELIRVGETGELFECGNKDALIIKIKAMWSDKQKLDYYSAQARQAKFDTLIQYSEKLLEIFLR